MKLGLEQTSVCHVGKAAGCVSQVFSLQHHRIQSLHPYLQVTWDMFHRRAPIPLFGDHQCGKWRQSGIWFKKHVPDLD